MPIRSKWVSLLTLAVAGAMPIVALADAPGKFKDGIVLRGPYCRAASEAYLLLGYPKRELKAEVWRRYEEAAMVKNEHTTIYSTSPRFIWANQAAISCAKAYGNLRVHVWKGRLDEDMVQKCECFYDRMVYFNRRR